MYNKEQTANEWVQMFESIYGLTSNQTKSKYEIFSHLTEVTLAFGKITFKRKDYEAASKFLPKIFAWAIALVQKVEGDKTDLESIILTKFPTVCPYCIKSPCICNSDKKDIDVKFLERVYYNKTNKQKRGLNDFQLMFKAIYGHTWNGNDNTIEDIKKLYLNLLEELSEVSEALRFYQLYPTNFLNEIADFLAWWFAITSMFSRLINKEDYLANDILWNKYPGICPSCFLSICDCRPGPVRELLSKPALREIEFVDGLTQIYNQNKFEIDITNIENGSMVLPFPIACIWIDIDNFKRINEDFSHVFGDKALKHIVSFIKQKTRLRDKIYRSGGDEFCILCPDLSGLEAKGMMQRVSKNLKINPLKNVENKSGKNDVMITFTAGITECNETSEIRKAVENADLIVIKNKEHKDTINYDEK